MQGYSPAAENNKSAILSVLENYLSDGDRVLEIGSGSGQHAIHVSASLQNIQWQPSDQAVALPLLRANIREYGSPNLSEPIELNLARLPESSQTPVQCVYSANVMHIVSKPLGDQLIRWAADILVDWGYLILYGPYKYDGDFTTQSNTDFDLWLKNRDPHSGIRDFEWVSQLATQAGLCLVEDYSMPANNQCLIFRKS